MCFPYDRGVTSIRLSKDNQFPREVPLDLSTLHEDLPMSATQNFFDNPAQGTAGGVGLGAGVGGLIGAALGNGGLFGNNREQVATLDQVDSRFNSLQGQLSADSLQSQIGGLTETVGRTSADSTIALGAGIAGVKDAVTHASQHNALALCNLGHAVESGFAGVNQNILLQGAQSRELALQQALDAERARATELRIALSEHKNQAGHQSTQVLLQQVIAAGKA